MAATRTPSETKNLDGYGRPPLEWSRVIQALDRTRELEIEDAAGHYWIATTRADGRPHVMPVGIVWSEGVFCLVAGSKTQKAKNLARDPRCSVSVAAPGLDIVAEGEARTIRDDAELHRIAELYSGWVRRCATAPSGTNTAHPAPGHPRGTSTRSCPRRCTRSRALSRTARPAGRGDIRGLKIRPPTDQ